MVMENIKKQISASIEMKQRLLADEIFINVLHEICQLCLKTYQGGGKLLIAGNGGSAADAQHIACELVGRFYAERKALPAIALSTDTSILTAVSNDYGYDQVFARQVEANGQTGDIFLAISTSGNSKNILEAIKAAKRKHLKVIGLTGATGGKMAEQCDTCLKVPSEDTPRIQEAQMMVGHIICCFIEEQFFKPAK